MAWVILAVILALFSFTPNFLSFQNIINILAQNAYVVIASLGVAFLMMAGEIDISAGYMMSLCSVSAGILMVQAGVPAAVAIAAVLVLGILLSMLNNFLSELFENIAFHDNGSYDVHFSGHLVRHIQVGVYQRLFRSRSNFCQGYVGPVRCRSF